MFQQNELNSVFGDLQKELDELRKRLDPMPSYPQNPIEYEGYTNIGLCSYPEETKKLDIKEIDSITNQSQFQVQFITENEAKEAFSNFFNEYSCYGKAPLDNFKIIDMKPSFKYVLQTFTETRSIQYAYEPNANLNQPSINKDKKPPNPWSFSVSPAFLFNDQEINLEIPNTSHIEICSKCQGYGTCICRSCGGDGIRRSGRFHKKCINCATTGYVTCKACNGFKSLKWFLQLTVTFKTNTEFLIKYIDDLPSELLRQCSATKSIFTEQNSRLLPLNNPNNQEMKQISFDLINKHLTQFKQSKILAQRHEVLWVPVTLVTYMFNEKPYSYVVYGPDNKAYSDNYPRKCFCCTIS